MSRFPSPHYFTTPHLKGFAASVSIVLSSVLSVFLFGFSPSPTFRIGALIVIVSTAAYQTPLEVR